MIFVRSSMSHDSYYIGVLQTSQYSACLSPVVILGYKVLFCVCRYNFSVNIRSLDTLVESFVHNSIDDNVSCFVNLLYGLIMIRERRLFLNDGVLTTGDVMT